MLSRPLILTGLLGAAVAGPMVANKAPEDWRTAWADFAGTPATETQPTSAPPVFPSAVPASELHNNGSRIYRSPAPIGGAVVSIDEALRMDINPQWVYARWARKSTGLADPDLFGVRTPLVTGNQMTDLAGALSYYFDADGVAQRLRFHGRTADTTQIVALAVQRFGMQRQQGRPGEQLYQRRTRSGVESELRTRPAAVLWGTSPHQSFVVDMEVNRPGSGKFVSPDKPRLEIPETPLAQSSLATTAPTANALAPPPAQQLAEQAPAAGPNAEPAAPDAGTGAEDGSLLGLRPGRLPPHHWPH